MIKKNEIIKIYIKNKVGVDVVDQMLQKYSTHCTIRRWLVAVWCSVLDIAPINSYIIYEKIAVIMISQQKVTLHLLKFFALIMLRREQHSHLI